eukprot:5084328-Pyramimonas_sp.AAC.1
MWPRRRWYGGRRTCISWRTPSRAALACPAAPPRTSRAASTLASRRTTRRSPNCPLVTAAFAALAVYVRCSCSPPRLADSRKCNVRRRRRVVPAGSVCV